MKEIETAVEKKCEAVDLIYEIIVDDREVTIPYAILLNEDKSECTELNRVLSEEVELLATEMELAHVGHLRAEVRNRLKRRLRRISRGKSPTPEIAAVVEHLRKSPTEKEPWQNNLLYYFSRFCGPANRENIQFMQRDLILEARDMQKAEHKKWFIATALTWRAIVGSMLPIMADGLWRLLKPVKEAKDIVKKSGD